MAQCTAIAKSGRPCKAEAMRGSEFCFWHSPETATARAAARKKGGFNRRRVAGSVSVEIETPGDVVQLLAGELASLLSRVEAGASRARAVGALCSVALRALEQGDLEERLSRLEEALGRESGRYAR